MKNYCILKNEGTHEETKPSLKVMVNQKLQVTIWCDRIITFVPEIDYELEDLEFYIQISHLFYPFYNNLKT